MVSFSVSEAVRILVDMVCFTKMQKTAFVTQAGRIATSISTDSFLGLGLIKFLLSDR